MPRKTKQELAAEKAAKALAARPFAPESTAPFGAMPEDEKAKVAAQIAEAKANGASGDEMRERFGSRLSGPARRKVLRAFGYSGTAYVARSYDSYRDGDSRTGTRHAREHGAEAVARRAEAREQAAQELAEAQAARKGRTKADKAAYAARVAECEARVASLA